ncbi:MAG: hypothetical protein ACO2OS_08095 [Thermosphaera aggregans]|jgi:hypothetical protein|uniref:hypothetical protein n=1 Tax=Thermosphaera aggregans TaxID=54254 RepID=UPI003C0399E2
MSGSKPSPDLRLYEKLLMMFPGYRGYKEKELVRETDRVVRDELYRKLKKSVSDLKNFYSSIVSSTGSTPASERVEKLIYRLDSLAEKTRHAPYGYRPLFHAFKVDENVLDRILEHDLNMGVTVEELNKTTSSRPSSILEVEKFLSDVEKLIEKYQSLLEERDRILSGIAR